MFSNYCDLKILVIFCQISISLSKNVINYLIKCNYLILTVFETHLKISRKQVI